MGLGRWTTDRHAEDAAIPATHFLVSSRRARSDDPRTDAAICILEAAATLPHTHDLLAQGLRHPDPLVQWTARRLLAEPAPVSRPGGGGPARR